MRDGIASTSATHRARHEPVRAKARGAGQDQAPLGLSWAGRAIHPQIFARRATATHCLLKFCGAPTDAVAEVFLRVPSLISHYPRSPAPQWPEDPAETGDSYKSRAAREPAPVDPGELTAEQEAEVRQLQRRDAEVRAHEAAHAAAAGPSGGGTSFTYTTGPDHRAYATSGEVAVQLSAGSSPEETIRNAQRVRSAALAPANPSSQDRAVASAAAAMEAQARMEALAVKAAYARQDVGSSRAAVRAATFDRSAEREAPGRSSDPDLDAAQLSNERRVAFGERGHLHSADGCGLCMKASSRYARLAST